MFESVKDSLCTERTIRCRDTCICAMVVLILDDACILMIDNAVWLIRAKVHEGGTPNSEGDEGVVVRTWKSSNDPRESEPLQHPPQNPPPRGSSIPYPSILLCNPAIQSYQHENTADRAWGGIAEAVDVRAEDVSVSSGIEVGVVDIVFVADDCKGRFGGLARIGRILAAASVSHMCVSRVFIASGPTPPSSSNSLPSKRLSAAQPPPCSQTSV